MNATTEEPSVAVIGAGVSGLALVHRLRNRGVDVTCFEASDSPGGIVSTVEKDGRVLELGPQRLRLTPPVEALVDELGLRDELREGDDDQPLYVYHDGGMSVAPLSVREAVTTDLLSWRAKARILAEPFTDDARDGETVEGFLTRKFGYEAARLYFGPLYSGLYGTPPDEMLVEYSLGRALENAGVDGSILLWLLKKLVSGTDTPPVVTFDDGLGRLSESLYDANADAVRLGTPVRAVESADDGYGVVTYEDEIRVDHVVVTTPAPTAAELLRNAAPAASEVLDRLSYNPIGVVHLDSGYDCEGIGVLVPHHEELSVSGLTWNASFLGRDRTFTCYIDPTSYPGMSDATDEELGSVAAKEFERIVGAPATPIHVHRWEPGMPAYDTTWTSLDDLELPDGLHLCSNYVERPGITGRLGHAYRLADEIGGESPGD